MADLSTPAMNTDLATSQALSAQSQARVNNAANAAGKTLSAADSNKMDQASQEYESMFVGEMLKYAFDTVPQDGMFNGGQGENIGRSFLVQEYAKKITQSGGIGMAAQVKSELIRLQAAHAQQ